MYKIIVLDGCDGCGKETQSTVVSGLLAEKYDILNLSFPNYNSPSSKVFTNFLEGKLRIHDYIHASCASNLDRAITMNSYEVKEFMNKHRETPNVTGLIICDRYTTSSYIYDNLDVMDLSVSSDDKHKIINERIIKIKNLEHLLNIPLPDKTYMLNLPYREVKKVICQRRGIVKGELDNDIYESNDHILRHTVELARIIHNFTLNCVNINCVDERNERRTIEDIACEIVKDVEVFINENREN